MASATGTTVPPQRGPRHPSSGRGNDEVRAGPTSSTVGSRPALAIHFEDLGEGVHPLEHLIESTFVGCFGTLGRRRTTRRLEDGHGRSIVRMIDQLLAKGLLL